LPKTGKNVVGTYVESTNQIYILDGKQDRTLAHEVGHLYQTRVLPKTLLRENITLYGKSLRFGTTITQYAKTSPQEYFAESFMTFVHEPGKLLAKDPNMHKFLKANVFPGVKK
jgi:hypothetical protein